MKGAEALISAISALGAVAGEIELGPVATDVPEQWITADDVALYLKVPKSWIYDSYRTLGVPHVKFGNKLRFRRTEIDAWLESRRGGAPDEPHSKDAAGHLPGQMGRSRK